MTADEETHRDGGSIHADQVGKVFIVVCRGVRKCLVCEQFFTRRTAAEHATVACYPTVPDVRPIGSPK